MEHLKLPTTELWESRRVWFEAFIFAYEEKGSYLVGEQASALISDVQACFCAGAWASVLILAFTVIDAHLQETSESDSKSRSAAELLKARGLDERFDGLRKRRNRLVHAQRESPALTVEDQWDSRVFLEAEARKAVELMFEAFYGEPGT